MDLQSIDLKKIIESETGFEFNRQGKSTCFKHEDKTPSLSVKFDSNKGKDVFTCFSCREHGDAIDFIKAYKNIDYRAAKGYLGIPVEKTKQENDIEKVKSYIGWQINNQEHMKDSELIGIFPFTDKDNKPLYYKAKFSSKDGKKNISYYNLENEKVKNSRGCDEVPYNLYKLGQAISSKKDIFIVEGEKDCNTLNKLGYIATSFKGVKEFNFSIFENRKIFIIPDTGSAGTKYKNDIWYSVRDFVLEFNVVELTDIDKLGDNVDVTDWLSKGRTKEELKACIGDSWNYKKSTLWRFTNTVTRNNQDVEVPLKVWQNLELLLKRENVDLKYNLISKEIEATGKCSTTRNELLTDIYTLNKTKGLNMSREEIRSCISKIGMKNSYNPFIDMVKENENNDYSLISKAFKCIRVKNEFIHNSDIYEMYFTKWCLNVIRMAHNTLINDYESQGVLTLQGKQGGFKSTFFKKLLSNPSWFKGGNEINPNDKDSIRKNTKYIVVELGELDSTLKYGQAKLKAFATDSSDEYRSPYAEFEERHPRLTTFCATVNKPDFLKDETGSRRWWVIPIEKCNVDELNKIDIIKFWGAIYSMYKSNKVPYWLSEKETELLNKNNISFASENDTSIILDDSINWEEDKGTWVVYKVSEICEILGINEKKSLKNTMASRGIEYKAHKVNGKTVKGYKLPKFKERTVREILNPKYMYK